MDYQLNHTEIRDAVSKLCSKFDGKYWQECDRNNQYPQKFVQALTDAGYLSSLIPEEYGGLGLPLSVGAAILEEIHKSGCNAAACHAQMYTMGTILRYGSNNQKEKYLFDSSETHNCSFPKSLFHCSFSMQHTVHLEFGEVQKFERCKSVLLEKRSMIDFQILNSPVTSDFAAFSLIYHLKIDQ